MVALPAMAVVIWKKILTVQGIIALVVLLTLIIGFFLGSTLGRIVCATGAGALVVYLYQSMKRDGLFEKTQKGKRQSGTHERESHSQPEEEEMKTLLFDDFQRPTADGYVVKDVSDEAPVVPSTRSAQNVPRRQEEKATEFDIKDFFDLDSDIFRGEAEPRNEFHFVLDKLLRAMKDVLFAHSVAFFWANREKQQMVLEAKATDSPNFMPAKRYPIVQDVASQVARSGKPQVLGRISPLAEKELVQHYTALEEIKSLIVVPVYYVAGSTEDHQLPEGVIVADSKAEDAFGAETLTLMGQFTKVISALIKSYTNRYDLLLDSELLTSLRRMQDRVKSGRSERAVLDALADEAVKLVNWDVLTVTMYSEESGGWSIQKVVNRTNAEYPSAETLIEFGESIVGRSIGTNTVVHVPDMEADRSVRFSASETILTKGSFLCIPISSLNRCYGALTLESAGKFQFSPGETEILYRLVESAALLLEVLYMNAVAKESGTIDQATGALNKKQFTRKLEEEVQRAEEFGGELALVSLAVDNMQQYTDRYGTDGFDTILQHVVKLIKANVQAYDAVGRIDTNSLNVLLVNTTADNAFLWAEKIRKHVASKVVAVGGAGCSVTVSVGVCGLNEGMNTDQLIAGTSQVLHKAIESGGNLVRIY